MCYTSQLVTQGPLTTGMLQLWVNTLNFWGANYVQKGWNTDSMHLQKRWYSWTKQRFIKAALSKSLEIGFNVLTTAFCFTVLPTNMLQSQEANTSLKAIFVCCRSLCIQTHIHISKDSGVYYWYIGSIYIYIVKKKMFRNSTYITCSSGWGACGGPCDGFHQWYHGLRRAAQRITVGTGKTLRSTLAEMSISVDGNPRFELHVQIFWFT